MINIRKTRIFWYILSFLFAPALVWGYVTLHTWVTGEVITETLLNTNPVALNAGLDALLQELKDSLVAVDARRSTIADSAFLHKSGAADSAWLHKNTVRDSVKNVIDDSSFAYKATLKDTLNTRLYTTIPILWSAAFADSFVSNDSLTIEISRSTPLGDTQCLYIRNAAAKPEKVRVTLDALLPNALSKLDSIHTQLWTELTTGADFASFYVRDDSTMVAWKAAQDSTGSQKSATARTTIAISKAISVNSIVGGRFRITSIFQLNPSDSMFVGPIEAIVSNR